MRKLIRRILAKAGYQLTSSVPRDFSADDVALVERVRPYTLTSPERIYSCVSAAEYLVKNRIPGDFVECGVWKGGIVMALALTLLRLEDRERHLYLYDTFEGMSPPTDADVELLPQRRIVVIGEAGLVDLEAQVRDGRLLARPRVERHAARRGRRGVLQPGHAVRPGS